MQIKIYDKYIFKQVFFATLVCILLFTIVWIAPETMLNTIRKVLDKTYTVSVGLQILMYEIPKILNKALPIGLFLGTLFTIDKLSKDSEITIFRNAGMSSPRIIAPVFVLSLFVSVLCFFVNNHIIPFACNNLYELKHDVPSSNMVYVQKDEASRPTQIIIMPSYNKDYISEPIVLTFSSIHYTDVSELKEIIIGQSGRFDDKRMVISIGKKYSINQQGIFENVQQVMDYNLIAPDKTLSFYKLAMYKVKRDRDLNNAQLVEYIKLLKQEEFNDDFRANLNKYLQRYFHSAMCTLFAILGCYLGFSKPREQKLIGFIIAIAITFLYYITIPPVDVAAEKGFLNPVIASLVHPIMLIIAILLIKKSKDV